jgi:hypothetical protein
MIFRHTSLTQQVGCPVIAFGGIEGHIVIITKVGLIHRMASLIRRIAFAYNRTMLKPVHIEITHKALAGDFSDRALEAILAANLRQDRLLALIGHDEYHFDSNAFEQSHAYLEEQRALTISALEAYNMPSAWSAFGRLIHTAQDFYAHSNYIDLWLSRQPKGTPPTSTEVDPLDKDLIQSHALRSGKVYLLEVLYLIRPLRSIALRLLPRDSHAWMNLDSPEQGPSFKYAFQAAIKRTKIEFNKTIPNLSHGLLKSFIDM